MSAGPGPEELRIALHSAADWVADFLAGAEQSDLEALPLDAQPALLDGGPRQHVFREVLVVRHFQDNVPAALGFGGDHSINRAENADEQEVDDDE